MDYHEKLLWYSSLSTGIFEVDNQHANIDMLLRFLADKRGYDQGLIDEIVDAVSSHFLYEESLLGSLFPKDHQMEHERLKKFLEFNIKEFAEGHLTLDLFAGTIQSALIEHASLYDSHLTEFL